MYTWGMCAFAHQVASDLQFQLKRLITLNSLRQPCLLRFCHCSLDERQFSYYNSSCVALSSSLNVFVYHILYHWVNIHNICLWDQCMFYRCLLEANLCAVCEGGALRPSRKQLTCVKAFLLRCAVDRLWIRGKYTFFNNYILWCAWFCLNLEQCLVKLYKSICMLLTIDDWNHWLYSMYN